MKRLLLHNKLGLDGKLTSAVIITNDFLNALFNIEKSFDNKETFSIIKNGEPRNYLLNHLTHADFQTMTILFKISFASTGTILNVRNHDIYQRLCDYYEKPISAADFYASLKKFELHKLIDITYIPEIKLYNIKLNHYHQPETDKIGFFSVYHPIIFSEDFHGLTIGQKKLFYSITMQQHGNKNRQYERLLDGSTHDHFRFYGLKEFLHRKEVTHIRDIMEPLKQKLSQEREPLFSKADLIKKISGGREINRYVKAVFSINSDYLVSYHKGEFYHDPLSPKPVYTRISNFIHTLLNNFGIGELYYLRNGLDFFQAVRYLKDFSFKVIRHAIYQLRHFVAKNKHYPNHIIEFLKQETRLKQEAVWLDVARKANIYEFIAYYEKGESRAQRETSFISEMSRYGIKAFKKACKLAYPRLMEIYTADPHEKLTVEDYRCHTLLDQVNGIVAARLYAFNRKVDLLAYERLEYKAAELLEKQLNNGEEDDLAITNFLLERVETLPKIDFVPDLDIPLEDFLKRFRLLPKEPLFLNN